MIQIIENPIILIDGSFYIYKAYHAYPALNTSSGLPVGAVYGFINMVKSLLIKYQPTDMGIIFDISKKTFRTDLFKKYKSNRIKMPEDLYHQLFPIREIIKSMGISILNVPHVEADDVIATLATFHAKSGKKVLISTGDKDMAQIVSSNIMLLNTKSNIILNSLEIEKKFGVPPELITDYLALLGDRSDNIPGVPGIGKKTAGILLNKIGELTILYQKLNKIFDLNIRSAKKIYDSLIVNKELAWLSYKLATIKTNIPLKKTDYILSIQKTDIQKLLSLFKKYEFKNWLKEIQTKKWLIQHEYIYQNLICSTFKKKLDNKNYIDTNSIFNDLDIKNKTNCIIHDHNTLKNWIKKNCTGNSIILNIYTNITDTVSNNIVSICVSAVTQNSCATKNAYIPIIHTDSQNIIHCNSQKNCFYLKEILLTLQPILENSKIEKIGHNMKFIYTILRKYNINLNGTIFDLSLELYILYGTVNYKNIKQFINKNIINAIKNFNQSYINYNNSYHTKSNIRNIQLELVYSIKFMHSIFNLHKFLWKKIQDNNKLKKIFIEIEIPLIFVLSRIEEHGVLIDKYLLHSYAIELDSKIHALKKQAHKLTGTTFNLSSTKQLQEILYNKQKFPILKRTPNGAPSTGEEVLKKLAKKYLIPKIILEYRSLFKLKSTYVNKLIDMIDITSHRIHTSYHQIRTATGRLSSTNPNLQNIPNRDYDGKKLRQAFIAPTNYLILSADYSQIELRIMAHLSNDFKLINDFMSGKDIHTITASELFVTKLHLVTKEQRQKAKTINFGLIYGMTAFGLAKQLSVTYQEAQKYVDRYFQRYSGIMQYVTYIKNHVYKYGYVSTLDGRKLYLPNIYSNNFAHKKSSERAAMNAPTQGSAADIIKKAMISIDYWLQKNSIPAHMIIQVHDELVFEVKNNFINIVVKKIKQLMEESFILNVPLKVDIGVGKNWEQAH